MSSFKFLLSVIVCLLLLVGSVTVDIIQQSRMKELKDQLERYETSTTSINVPNIMTGEIETLLVMGVAELDNGHKIPLLVNEEEYYAIYTNLRSQYLALIELEKRKTQSEQL